MTKKHLQAKQALVIRTLLISLMPLLILACGKEDKTVESDKAAVTKVPRLSETERHEYCAFYVSKETDEAARDAFLTQLDGKWRVVLAESQRHEKIFEFAKDVKYARLWDIQGFIKDYDDIKSRRICVSKPLTRADEFNGFRLVEFEAKNNEGIVAIAMKFAPNSDGHAYPELQTSDYHYYRWAQSETPKPVKDFFSGRNGGMKLWVYPERK